MFTSAPDITVDTTIGQVVVESTATPTSASTGTSTSSSTPASSTSSTDVLSPLPTLITKNYKPKALNIYGYGPVNSEVTLKGFGVSEVTTSDDIGLFRFGSVYSFSYTYPELCIQAVDLENRVTQPTCIPALPNDSIIPLEVGPILLSPTLSLSNNEIPEGEESYLYGKTTPDTEVFIYLAKNESKNKISLVPTVDAYSLPILNTTSNEKGEFEFTMPTAKKAEYNIFASTKVAGNLSAKSNTLKFVVVSSVKSFFQGMWGFVLENKIMIFITTEVLVFIALFSVALKKPTRKHKRHLEKDYLEGTIKVI